MKSNPRGCDHSHSPTIATATATQVDVLHAGRGLVDHGIIYNLTPLSSQSSLLPDSLVKTESQISALKHRDIPDKRTNEKGEEKAYLPFGKKSFAT